MARTGWEIGRYRDVIGLLPKDDIAVTRPEPRSVSTATCLPRCCAGHGPATRSIRRGLGGKRRWPETPAPADPAPARPRRHRWRRPSIQRRGARAAAAAAAAQEAAMAEAAAERECAPCRAGGRACRSGRPAPRPRPRPAASPRPPKPPPLRVLRHKRLPLTPPLPNRRPAVRRRRRDRASVRGKRAARQAAEAAVAACMEAAGPRLRRRGGQRGGSTRDLRPPARRGCQCAKRRWRWPRTRAARCFTWRPIAQARGEHREAVAL